MEDQGLMQQSGREVKIIAGKLFDSRKRCFVSNQLITVSPHLGLITDVRAVSQEEQASLIQEAKENIDTLDFSNKTVLPGFVDAHVHCMLQILRIYLCCT
jgi:imidazolonepropionase-like amidohydrolase